MVVGASIARTSATLYLHFLPLCRRLSLSGMKTKAHGTPKRIELGEYIVADPLICHGKPTFKGTRIMVWQILEDLARGESVDEIVHAWGGRVPREAILETIRLAGGALLDKRGGLNRHYFAR